MIFLGWYGIDDDFIQYIIMGGYHTTEMPKWMDWIDQNARCSVGVVRWMDETITFHGIGMG